MILLLSLFNWITHIQTFLLSKFCWWKNRNRSYIAMNYNQETHISTEMIAKDVFWEVIPKQQNFEISIHGRTSMHTSTRSTYKKIKIKKKNYRYRYAKLISFVEAAEGALKLKLINSRLIMNISSQNPISPYLEGRGRENGRGGETHIASVTSVLWCLKVSKKSSSVVVSAAILRRRNFGDEHFRSKEKGLARGLDGSLCFSLPPIHLSLSCLYKKQYKTPVPGG